MRTAGDMSITEPIVEVTDGGQIVEVIRQVKKGSRGFVTNFFAGHKQIDPWVRRSELSLVQTGRCVWIRRRDRDFAHLYYFAADSQALEESLAGVDGVAGGMQLAIDLVGRQGDVDVLAEAFRRHGFADQAVLVRMSLVVDASSSNEVMAVDAVAAVPADAPAIVALLERWFDRYSKQIPLVEEVQEAISAGSILLVRRGEKIAGLLFFEAAGATATLRYWCVDEPFRDEGIGASLIRSMFHLCRSCKSIVLWVCAENENAIRRYKHYGFRETDTVDRILLRR